MSLQRHILVVRDQAIGLYEDGKTVDEIVTILKTVPEATIRKWIAWDRKTYPNGYPAREIDRRCRQLGNLARAQGLGVDGTITVRHIEKRAA